MLNLGLKYELLKLKDFDEAYEYFEKFLRNIDYYTFDRNVDNRAHKSYDKNCKYQDNLFKEIKLVSESIAKNTNTLDQMVQVTDCLNQSELASNSFVEYYAVAANLLAGDVFKKTEHNQRTSVEYSKKYLRDVDTFNLEDAMKFFISLPRAYGYWDNSDEFTSRYFKYWNPDERHRYKSRNTNLLEHKAVEAMIRAYDTAAYSVISDKVNRGGVCDKKWIADNQILFFNKSLSLLHVVVLGIATGDNTLVHNNYKLLDYSIDRAMELCKNPEQINQLIKVIEAGYKPESVRTKLQMLNMFYGWSQQSTNQKAVV